MENYRRITKPTARNILDEAEFVEANEGEYFKLNAKSGDVIRVRGLDVKSISMYDSDGNVIEKVITD